MAAALDDLRFVQTADVHKAGRLAGHLARTPDGGNRFSYLPDYVDAQLPPVATTLPLGLDPVDTPSGSLPPFFAGLLPEGHRLTILRNAAKTSLDDELTLLLAVGADVPGDVEVVPSGQAPEEPPSLADAASTGDLDFTELAVALDLHGLPGVQAKTSASMLTAPLALRGRRFILKLDPPEYPHLVENEALHLEAARQLRIPVARGSTVTDRHGRKGLLVERFDRTRTSQGNWTKVPLEDAAQVLGIPPARKYNVSAEDVVAALSGVCSMPVVAARNMYLQFLFAWLTGNGDLHAKNISFTRNLDGRDFIAPVYDVPCTLLYRDDSMALPVGGKTKKLRAKHWEGFAADIGLPARAARTLNTTALRAAASIDLTLLPFTGSPLNYAVRELRSRRHELE